MTMKLPELWLQYAFDDLKSARVLLKEKIFNMVCFHSQQVAEKLFKSLIASYNKEIPRTHNLIRLHSICEELYEDKLEIDNDALIFLNDVYISKADIPLISVYYLQDKLVQKKQQRLMRMQRI